MDSTIEWLPYFLAVAENGSFTAAASALGQTKSRVSRAVSRLEATLETELFHRTTRAVALTTAGVALFERAAPLLAALREAWARCPSDRRSPRASCASRRRSIWADRSPTWSRAPRCAGPRVRVDMSLTGRRVDLVREGFDLAIRATAGPMGGAVAHRAPPGEHERLAVRLARLRRAPRQPA